MKKTITAFFLSAALLLSPVLAVESGERFPAVNAYPGYADVKEGDWFYSNAKLCYEVGLMTGTDAGFEPGKVLTQAEAVTLAARVGATLRGETIPAAQPGEPWWSAYNQYVFPQGGINSPDDFAGRWQFLFMLYGYVEDLLVPINDVQELPDPDFRDDVMTLKYYNAGILTGTDKYGTFHGGASLTRAEAAAMLSRIIRPELRIAFVPADYSPFTAAYTTPDTVFFETGVTAEGFLTSINSRIAHWEGQLGDDFNWLLDVDGKTVLQHVKEETLTACGCSEAQGTQAYKEFDYQVYYSRLIDLTGGLLGPDPVLF